MLKMLKISRAEYLALWLTSLYSLQFKQKNGLSNVQILLQQHQQAQLGQQLHLSKQQNHSKARREFLQQQFETS